MNVKILLADDHRIFREALRELILDGMQAEVVGEADNGIRVVELAGETKPDIVIMDVNMPRLNGIEATRKIMEIQPRAKVICLSMHADERFVDAMFAAGAVGYLLKVCACEELISAIGDVLKGREYLSPGIERGAEITTDDAGMPAASVFNTLTSREREVLQLYAEGSTTKEIAAYLDISEKTVGTHRAHMMEKLNLTSIADLTKYAVRQGITSL